MRNRKSFGVCFKCGSPLDKDHVALGKKLFGIESTRFMCLNCMSEYLGVSIEILLTKIEEFKERGCSLFK